MSVIYKCTARRMAGGNGHEHISLIWWVKVLYGAETAVTGVSSRQELVRHIERYGSNMVCCPDRDPYKKWAWVHVQDNEGNKYLQTVADGSKTDNLLALPER